MPTWPRADRIDTSRSRGARRRRTRGAPCRRFRADPSYSRRLTCAAPVPIDKRETDRTVDLRHDLIEKVAPGAILDLDDPGIGVEAQLADQAFLDLGLGHRLLAQASAEQPIGRARIVEGTLRRRAEQLRSSIEPVQLDENGARLLGAT